MSVSGILSNNSVCQPVGPHHRPPATFQQLGKDLIAGDLNGAQQDYTTLQLGSPSPTSASPSVSAGTNSSQNTVLQDTPQPGQVPLWGGPTSNGSHHYPLPPTQRPPISVLA